MSVNENYGQSGYERVMENHGFHFSSFHLHKKQEKKFCKCFCYRTDPGWWGELLPKGPSLLLRGSPLSLYLVRLAHHHGKDISQYQRLVKRKGIIYLKVIQT